MIYHNDQEMLSEGLKRVFSFLSQEGTSYESLLREALAGSNELSRVLMDSDQPCEDLLVVTHRLTELLDVLYPFTLIKSA